MGDRSQIAIKQGDGSKVYLYGHSIGADIYPILQGVIAAGARLDDDEYLARIVFREMGAGDPGETGFGIGTSAHGDIGHLIPVLDCEKQEITFEIPEGKQGRVPQPPAISFANFAKARPHLWAGW